MLVSNSDQGIGYPEDFDVSLQENAASLSRD
jgi:hypothetical protein